MRHLTLRSETLSTRAADDGSLEIEGLAVPWNTPIDYAGIAEQFARGAFPPDSVIGRPLLWSHDRSEPIGHITDARDTPEGLAITAVVQPTSRGRDAITLLRSQSLRGLSVGFEPTQQKATPTGVTYTRAILHELSTTPLPAYPSAAVTATRAEEDPVADPTTTETREAVDLAPITDRLDQIEARMLADRPAPEPAVRVHPRDTFVRLVREYGEDRSRISQRADMVSTGNTGLTSTERTSSELIEYFDNGRYFVSHVASIPFPDSGITHTLPKKTQRSLVGKAAEKAAAPSRAITTSTVQFTGEWYKGYLDISYELIRTSSPGAVAVAVDDMLGEAAVESEKMFVAAVEAAATAGSALVFTDYKAFVTSVRAAVRTIRDTAGRGTPKFAITPDNWDLLLALTDADGRRILSTVGPANADGSAPLTAEELTLAGIMFFESPYSTVDVAFNDNSLKRSELPPMQLSADNVPLIGRDVGILGNIMAIPRIPDGVVKLGA